MVKVNLGKTGTGKTKSMIEYANNLVGKTSGDIVFIDNNSKHMFDLNHDVRFINTEDFDINDERTFLGFIYGIIAENFDIHIILIDNFLKIVGLDINEISNILKKLEEITDKFNIKLSCNITADPKKVPDFIKKYLE